MAGQTAEARRDAGLLGARELVAALAGKPNHPVPSPSETRRLVSTGGETDRLVSPRGETNRLVSRTGPTNSVEGA
jgi:hypothetical protein